MPEPLISPEIESASTIPSRFYGSSEIYERAKEAVFAKSWQWIGHEELVKVPGSIQPLTLLEGYLDEPLLLTRDANDQVRLISNVCTHRGMLVAESGGNERFLRCRYHGRRFGLDGVFQHMPEFEGVCGFPSEADNLPNIPFSKWGPFLFGSLAPAMSLEEFLKPMIERMEWLPLHEFHVDAKQSRDYVVRANWALYVDNYLEGFHIPFVHAALNAVVDYDNYGHELYSTGNLQVAVSKSGEDSFDLPKCSPDYGSNIAAYYYWFFPNLMLNFYPWGLSVNLVRPLGPELTKVSFIRYVWKEALVGTGAGGDLDRVEREDEVIVEAVQKGVKSRFYDRGRYSPKREQCTHHFHRLFAEALSDAVR